MEFHLELDQYQNSLTNIPNSLALKRSNQTARIAGGKYDYLEHFRPLVEKGQPTGYGSDIYNLVPSCSSCNVRKGNMTWQDWMQNEHNPGVSDEKEHAKRFSTLLEFDSWGKDETAFVNYEKLIGSKKWKEYQEGYAEIIKYIEKIHPIQKEIKALVNKTYNHKK